MPEVGIRSLAVRFQRAGEFFRRLSVVFGVAVNVSEQWEGWG